MNPPSKFASVRVKPFLLDSSCDIADWVKSKTLSNLPGSIQNFLLAERGRGLLVWSKPSALRLLLWSQARLYGFQAVFSIRFNAEGYPEEKVSHVQEKSSIFSRTPTRCFFAHTLSPHMTQTSYELHYYAKSTMRAVIFTADSPHPVFWKTATIGHDLNETFFQSKPFNGSSCANFSDRPLSPIPFKPIKFLLSSVHCMLQFKGGWVSYSVAQ